jgi:predicted nucleic acid-binding protein
VIVIDTHLAVCLFLPGNANQHAEELLVRDSRWVVPGLFFSEFKSVLSGLLRQGAMNLSDAIAYVNEAETVLERAPFSPNHGRILELSLGSGCPAYACEFVALAEMLDVPLVTVDPRVLQAFPRLAMSPSAYLNQSATP